jgi:hypothetical protein
MAARHLTMGIAIAGLLIAIAAAAKFAEHAGVVGSEAAARTTQVIVSLVVAYMGNLMPKRNESWRSLEAESRIQSALRVGGWLFTLAGLASAGVWLLAPMALAGTVSTAILASATVVTMGYAAWCIAACFTSKDAGATERE